MIQQILSIKNIFTQKYIFIIFTLLSFTNLKSQSTIIDIDSMMEASQVEKSNGDFKKFLNSQTIILNYSKKAKYSKGIAMAYHNIGQCYQNFRNCSKALMYYNNALKEDFTKNDLSLQSDINCSIGNCYRQQHLYTEALHKYRKAIIIGEKSDDDVSFIKALNYSNIGSLYTVTKDSKDSSYYYLTKANYYLQHISNSKRIGGKKRLGPVICLNLGMYWKRNKRLDSAKYYFFKGIELNKSAKNVISQAFLEFSIGDLFLETEENKNAEYYLEKSKTIYEVKKDINTLPQIYSALIELNKRLGNEKKIVEYQDSLINISAQVSSTEKASIMSVVDNINKEKNDVFVIKEGKLYNIIIVIVLLTVLIFISLIYFHKKMKREKNDTISDSTIRLAKKREIILQKEKETDKLKQMVNISFDEVVHLAKENSPEFFTRFQEVYPELINKLLNKDSKLRVSELTLCAYIYLGFNTKDIAKYTFRSISTVKNRKNNLKKKFNLSTDENIELWMKGNI